MTITRHFRYGALLTRVLLYHPPPGVEITLSLDPTHKWMILLFVSDIAELALIYGPDVPFAELMAIDLAGIANDMARKSEPIVRAADEFERAMERLSVARDASRREMALREVT